jgi:hypothetical protein
MKNFIDPCNASGPIYRPPLILHVLPPADPTALGFFVYSYLPFFFYRYQHLLHYRKENANVVMGCKGRNIPSGIVNCTRTDGQQ